MKHKLLKSLLLLSALVVGSSSVWAQSPVTIWSENFDGLAAEATPTTPTNAAYTGVTYTCTNGAGSSAGSTKIANEKLAGGANEPEMMVGKKGSGTGAAGGKFTAVIPLDNFEGTLTLTYYQNKQTLNVRSTTDGVSGGQSIKPSSAGQQTTTFTGITKSMTSITIYFESTTTNNVRLDDIVLTGYKASSIVAPTFSPAGGIYTSAKDVTLSCETGGTTIYYTTNGTTPTSSSTQYTGAISVSTTTTIKAIAKKDDDYSSVSTATYAILPHAGTEADPFTVTDARNALTAEVIDEGTDYYVTGYVAKKNDISSGQMTYWISDDGGMTSTIQCFKGKYIDGASFTESNAPVVGDLAIVKGKLTIYSGTTYEFTENNEVVSITPQPTITVSETSLSNIDYVIDNGPSDAHTFTVSGSNLTADITLSLGGSSNFEMSTTEGSGYTNSLTLTKTAGAVAATTIYVRLKSGFTINKYNGTITLSSTGALGKSVSLTGNVTDMPFTWDLSKDITETATEEEMTWKGTAATMAAAKGSATTATNNYYPGIGQSSTRFYKNSTLTITPVTGYTITSIVFTATTSGYATALQNSSWTNASAIAQTASEPYTVTVNPTTGTSAVSATIGGTCGFTEVKVYYTGSGPATTTVTLAAACTDGAFYYGTYSNSRAFVVPNDIIVSEIKIESGELKLTDYETDDVVPANTGVLIASDVAGAHTLTYSGSAGTSKLGANNLLKPSGDMGIAAATMNVANTKFYRLTMHNGTKFGFYWGATSGAAFKLTANKAYLAVPTGTPVKEFYGFDFSEDADGINEVNGSEFMVNGPVYDLQGRRVLKPGKGLYIVNGKKVLF